MGGLIDCFFRLPFLFIAPDVIIEELKEPDGKKLISLGLRKVELAGKEVQQVIELAGRYPAPSRADLFALTLAKTRHGVLLTGDRHLRKAAEQEKVQVHGTLWILDQLVNREIITPIQAAQALEKMLAKGRRLPRFECKRRLKKWKSQAEYF